MKQKTPTCSTGHDTGVSYARGLHEVLADERRRKIEKKRARLGKRFAVLLKQREQLAAIAKEQEDAREVAVRQQGV